MGMVIWTTTQCNMNCTYCYETISGQKNKIGVKRNITEFLERLYNVNPQMMDLIIFHGGEPLLNYELIGEISDFVKLKGWETQFAFTTNGTIWNERIREILLNNKDAFEEGISISIDGTEENHNACRKNIMGDGTYCNVVNTLEHVLEDFPNIYARMTVNAKTVKSLCKNVKHISELGIKRISLSADFFDEDWTEELARKLEEEFEKIILFWMEHRELEISIVDQIFNKRRLGGCSLSYNLYTDGNIYPCTYLAGNKNYIIGNLEKGIDETRVKELEESINKTYEFCSKCENVEYCIHNRCKLMNCAIYGDVCEPSKIGCRIENIKYKLYKKYHCDINKTRKGVNE